MCLLIIANVYTDIYSIYICLRFQAIAEEEGKTKLADSFF